jgi:hypothetical protein
MLSPLRIRERPRGLIKKYCPVILAIKFAFKTANQEETVSFYSKPAKEHLGRKLPPSVVMPLLNARLTQ